MFELNGSTLVGIGAVLGALAGAVSFLFKALVNAKDEHIADLHERAAAATQDRDFWRDVALGHARAGEKEAWLRQQEPPASRRTQTRSER